MRTIIGAILAGGASLALLLGATDAVGQDACDHGGNHVIRVTEGADGQPVLSYKDGSAEEVRVCVGDTVRWVLTGSDREFFVDFFAGAPFGGDANQKSSGGAVSVTIGDVEKKGYDYGVNFAGEPPMDPRIVVD